MLSQSLPSAHSCIVLEERFQSAQGAPAPVRERFRDPQQKTSETNVSSGCPHQSRRGSETPSKRHHRLKSAQGAPALVQEKFRDPQQKTSEAKVSSGGVRTSLGEVQRPPAKDIRG